MTGHQLGLTTVAQSTNATAFTVPPYQQSFRIDRIEVRITHEDDYYFWKNTKYFDDKFENCGGYRPWKTKTIEGH